MICHVRSRNQTRSRPRFPAGSRRGPSPAHLHATHASLPALFRRQSEQAIVELSAYRSPWQNGIERWVGTVRRELLDHVIVINERQLRRLLSDYVAYYNEERVHTGLRDSPKGRAVQVKPSSSACVVALPHVGGLHHRYEWSEAA